MAETGDDVKKMVLIDKEKAKIKTGKRSNTITDDEILAVDDVNILFKRMHDKVRCIIEFLYYTDYRVSELMGARVKDVSFIKNVKINLVEKGKKQRRVALPRDVYSRIKKSLQRNGAFHQLNNLQKTRKVNFYLDF